MSGSSRPTPASTPPSTPGSPQPRPPEAGPQARLLTEAGRKSLHVVAAAAGALLVRALDPVAARILFAGTAALSLAIDVVRLRRPGCRRVFDRIVGPLLRTREDRHLTGATTLAFGFALAVLLFPGRAALAGLLYGGLADAVAAVVGRAFGRRRIRGGRTVEGSVAFFIVAFGIGVLAAGLTTTTAGIVALALALLELLPLPFDDNVLLPGAGALLVTLAAGPF